MNKVNKILYFTARWCGPCKLLRPVMDEIAEEISVDTIDVDVDTKSLVSEYNIKSIPTLVFLDADGFEVDRKIGTISKEAIRNTFTK